MLPKCLDGGPPPPSRCLSPAHSHSHSHFHFRPPCHSAHSTPPCPPACSANKIVVLEQDSDVLLSTLLTIMLTGGYIRFWRLQRGDSG